MRLPKRPARSAAGAAALLLIVVAAVELTAWTAYWIATGRRFSYRPAAPTATGVSAVGERVAPDGLAPEPERFPVAKEILHPFLGFVQDPAVRRVPDGSGWRLRSAISPHGFFDFDPRPPRPGRVTVAVVGGSMAVLLVKEAGAELARLLAQDPRFAGRPVDVVNWANPGYKQPQPLLTVTYLTAMGEMPDLVINLDGYNDVVLGYTEGVAAGVYPFYPRAWAARVAAVPDLERVRRLGEASLWRQLEDRLAARRGGWLARHSALVALARRALGQELARRAALAEAAAQRPAPHGAHDFLSQGPPFAPKGEAAFLDAAAGVWSRSSRALDQLCRGHGISYHHFLQPNQYVTGSKPMGREERLRALGDSPGRRLVTAGYPRLAAAGAALRASGVAFTDLQQVFAGVRSPLYIDSCCHVGPEGNRLLARAIAAAVRSDPPRPTALPGAGLDAPP